MAWIMTLGRAIVTGYTSGEETGSDGHLLLLRKMTEHREARQQVESSWCARCCGAKMAASTCPTLRAPTWHGGPSAPQPGRCLLQGAGNRWPNRVGSPCESRGWQQGRGGLCGAGSRLI
jgi:hypothetical protein